MLKRTDYCGEITEKHTGQDVIINGWLDTRRDHGGVIFLDIRDRTGIVQAVFDPAIDSPLHERAHKLRSEYVLGIKGKVRKRPEGTENPSLKTGLVEIVSAELEVLNRAETPPFVIEDEAEVSEELRLKYRFLDLRRPKIMKNLFARHRVYELARKYLNSKKFIETETPFLIKSTPEGARDYLVPSRLNEGHFYALPQSPQTMKQILMVSGLDRYYQIVKCFRDEDLRADRQPEFTQIDLEMSFVDEEDVMETAEGLTKEVFGAVLDKDFSAPFTRMTYKEAMDRFGTDSPDMRFGLELKDVSGIFKSSGFRVFAEAVEKGGIVKSINFKEAGKKLSRREIDELVAFAQKNGAGGMAWIKFSDKPESPIVKFLGEGKVGEIKEAMNVEKGDITFFIADMPDAANEIMSRVRLHIGKKYGLIKGGELRFVWVTDFPLLKYDSDEKRYTAAHHPFTAVKPGDESLVESAPASARSRAYDLVLNGTELGGGSIRIHNPEFQKKMFSVLNIGDEEAEERFGFLLKAFKYGAPPHGGFAFGLDRMLMIITGSGSIRDVIAFPKTQKAECMLTGAPGEVDPSQLKELHIKPDIE